MLSEVIQICGWKTGFWIFQTQISPLLFRPPRRRCEGRPSSQTNSAASAGEQKAHTRWGIMEAGLSQQQWVGDVSLLGGRYGGRAERGIKKSLYQGILAICGSSRRSSKRGRLRIFCWRVRGTLLRYCGGCYLGLHAKNTVSITSQAVQRVRKS